MDGWMDVFVLCSFSGVRRCFDRTQCEYDVLSEVRILDTGLFLKRLGDCVAYRISHKPTLDDIRAMVL